MADTDVDSFLEVAGPGRYILVVPKTAGTMMLRINENDRIRLDAYGERMEVRLEGLSAFVEALDRWRLDADAAGLEPFRV